VDSRADQATNAMRRANWRRYCNQFLELTGTCPGIRWRPWKAWTAAIKAIAGEKARLSIIVEDWEEEMSETHLTAVMLMIGMIVLIMAFWRLIAIFLLAVAVTVFCFGAYYIMVILLHLIWLLAKRW
jgi:hypothetical protein